MCQTVSFSFISGADESSEHDCVDGRAKPVGVDGAGDDACDGEDDGDATDDFEQLLHFGFSFLRLNYIKRLDWFLLKL